MSLVVTPRVSKVGIDGKKVLYAISFVFTFNGESTTETGIGGIACPGFNYQLDLSSMQLPVNFSDFESLQFSQQFDNSDAPNPDGPLIINTPGTSQSSMFGAPVTDLTGGTPGAQIGLVSGAMPIFLGTQSIINFYNGANGRTPLNPLPPFGELAATLYNFKISSYMHSGFAYFDEAV